MKLLINDASHVACFRNLNLEHTTKQSQTLQRSKNNSQTTKNKTKSGVHGKGKKKQEVHALKVYIHDGAPCRKKCWYTRYKTQSVQNMVNQLLWQTNALFQKMVVRLVITHLTFKRSQFSSTIILTWVNAHEGVRKRQTHNNVRVTVARQDAEYNS